MNRVYPINKGQITKLREQLLEDRNGERNEFMLVFMLNIPLRVNDAINLKVIDVKNKKSLIITPSKSIRTRPDGTKTSGKKIEYIFSDFLKDRIQEYIKNMDAEDYLFQSQKGDNRPITRSQAWRILNSAGQKIGIKEPFGCHSTRKTYARMLLEKYGDMAYVMEKLGHKNQVNTMFYLHITQEKDAQRVNEMPLF